MVTSQEEVEWGLKLGRDTRILGQLLLPSLPETLTSQPCHVVALRLCVDLYLKEGGSGHLEEEDKAAGGQPLFPRQEKPFVLGTPHCRGVALLCELVFLGHLQVRVGTLLGEAHLGCLARNF